MADILVRDVPEEVVAAIDANARNLGVSRTEYIRRALARERPVAAGGVTIGDLARAADTFADLGDPEVMGRAWS